MGTGVEAVDEGFRGVEGGGAPVWGVQGRDVVRRRERRVGDAS